MSLAINAKYDVIIIASVAFIREAINVTMHVADSKWTLLAGSEAAESCS